jgi:mRNA-degrading endonuclease YafQ of YafQ-DinJ toxin-antitoxin module
MRTLIWGKHFVRALKRTLKKHPTLGGELAATLRTLQEDPFSSRIATHKLKGKLCGSWACRMGYDLRLIFDFVENPEGADEDILLLEIGSHDEVY